jgi:Fe-S cluster biogenesis protein NfuA
MIRKGVLDNIQPLGNGGTTMNTPVTSPKDEQLKVLLNQLSAYIEQFHGGSVDFVGFDGVTLKVRLGGACLGCPLSPSTLHGWVEGTVKQFFPEIKNVEAA